MRRLLAPLIVLFALSPFHAVLAWADDIRVGVLAYQGSERATHDWDPTFAYLDQALPNRHFTMIPLDLEGIRAAVQTRGVDFIVTNPGDYISLEGQAGLTRIATLESGPASHPSAAVASAVIVPSGGNGPASLDALAGHRLAITATDAFGGFQIIWREMRDAGVDPFDGNIPLDIAGFPMSRVIDAIRSGQADAGVLRACELERMIATGQVREGEFRVIGARTDDDLPCLHSSRLYPDWPFARLSSTPPALAKAVAAALLAMPAENGRSWTVPLDYSPVTELFRILRIDPYGRSARPSLLELAKSNWQWIGVVIAAILWWIAHVARVENLVRRRTAQLRHEMVERARAEETAQRHREERDRLSRLSILGEMSSNIAHELNQPLAAIANYAHGMVRLLGQPSCDPALLKNGATAITQQAERAAAIMQRIRGFVRRRPPQRTAIDLNDVIAETMTLFDALAHRRSIRVHLALAASLPPVVADRVEIQQVLFNLLQNAFDAMAPLQDPDERGDWGMERKAPTAAGAIAVASVLSDDAIMVGVTDGGGGLSPETAPHLFEPFFTTKPDGLGLGLSICRTIVESHGGRLWATPNEEAGLTMRFTLPVSHADRTSEAAGGDGTILAAAQAQEEPARTPLP